MWIGSAAVGQELVRHRPQRGFQFQEPSLQAIREMKRHVKRGAPPVSGHPPEGVPAGKTPGVQAASANPWRDWRCEECSASTPAAGVPFVTSLGGLQANAVQNSRPAAAKTVVCRGGVADPSPAGRALRPCLATTLVDRDTVADPSPAGRALRQRLRHLPVCRLAAGCRPFARRKGIETSRRSAGDTCGRHVADPSPAGRALRPTLTNHTPLSHWLQTLRPQEGH